MTRLTFVLAGALITLLVACGTEFTGASAPAREERAIVERALPAIAPQPAPAAPAPPASAPSFAQRGASAKADAGEPPSAGALETAQRKVISRASVSIEVEVVQEAVTQVRFIAESLGGFVEQLSTTGDPKRQRATMTIRVVQEEFFAALERIMALGEVQGQSVGSEDVTERFIDLEARLKSALRQEESLLSLLGRTQSVSEVLTVERELSRVRSEIERLQGQLNFLKRRVDLATITVPLSPPRPKVTEPPFVSLTMGVPNVTGSVEEVKTLLASLRRKSAVDQVSLSVRDGQETAQMSVRVFAADFEPVLASIEELGKIVSKDLREGREPAEGAEQPEEPDAHLNIVFEEEPASSTGLVVAIGGLALALLLGLLFYLTYRAGRRRAT